jgi:PilZ domain
LYAVFAADKCELMPPEEQNRRKQPRSKTNIPVELRALGSRAPIHCMTSDLSLTGCYVEMMFTLPIRTTVEIRLQLQHRALFLWGQVTTCDPHVGNGIESMKVRLEVLKELASELARMSSSESGDPTD